MRYIFLTLLIGHALGSFYFRKQSNSDDEARRTRASRLHMLIYAASAAFVLFACMQISVSLVTLWALTVMAHILIDTAIAWLPVLLPYERLSQSIKKYRFFIVHLLHFIVLLGLSMGFRGSLQIYPWLITVWLPPTFLFYATGVVYLLKPVSIAIAEFFLAAGFNGGDTVNAGGSGIGSYNVIGNGSGNGSGSDSVNYNVIGNGNDNGSGSYGDNGISSGNDSGSYGDNVIVSDSGNYNGNVSVGESQNSFVRAGSLIGMLERVLAFILIINNQYGAVGFLITAKTVARFKDLEKREVAEYYLIGTLLSITAAFIIAILCNLLTK